MQREITKRGKLLNAKGELNERGYSTSFLLDYNKDKIQGSKLKIKEWDYYLMISTSYGVALTIADNGYMGIISISVLDFKRGWYKTQSHILPFTLGKLNLPRTTTKGEIHYVDHKVEIYFMTYKGERRLRCYMKEFYEGKPFECEFLLGHMPQDSIVVATPFKESSKQFYYNQKIIGMKARGYMRTGKLFATFRQEDTYAILDWGRGIWPYESAWYWGAAMGEVEGKSIGFNIGYGFGDTSAATENVIFYEGKANKLEQVTCKLTQKDGRENYLSSWQLTSSDGRLEMEFIPILDRKDYKSIGIIMSDQHQVFGHFSGRFILDDEEVVEIKNVFGFIEKVRNRW